MRFIDCIRQAQKFAHKHEMAFQRCHHVCYLSYFSTIVLHGPYHLIAGVLFVVVLVGWILMEETL